MAPSSNKENPRQALMAGAGLVVLGVRYAMCSLLIVAQSGDRQGIDAHLDEYGAIQGFEAESGLAVQEWLDLSAIVSGIVATVVRRPNVPPTAQDEADLALLRSSAPHREALARLTPAASPVEQAISESLLLHCVLAAGFEAIRRSAEEAGYEGLAAQYAEQADHRHVLRRRLQQCTQSPPRQRTRRAVHHHTETRAAQHRCRSRP